MAMIYNLDSGIMLYHTANSPPAWPRKGAGLDQGSESHHEAVQSAAGEYPLERRQPSLLGHAGTILCFQGQHSFWLPHFLMWLTVSPLSVELQIRHAHSRFAEGRQQTYTAEAMQPAYVPMVSGIAQLMGFWVPEEALSLQPGAVDYDPDTGMTVSVLESGSNGLLMEETNNINCKLTAAYDARGKVVQTATETYSGTATGQRDVLQLVE